MDYQDLHKLVEYMLAQVHTVINAEGEVTVMKGLCDSCKYSYDSTFHNVIAENIKKQIA